MDTVSNYYQMPGDAYPPPPQEWWQTYGSFYTGEVPPGFPSIPSYPPADEFSGFPLHEEQMGYALSDESVCMPPGFSPTIPSIITSPPISNTYQAIPALPDTTSDNVPEHSAPQPRPAGPKASPRRRTDRNEPGRSQSTPKVRERNRQAAAKCRQRKRNEATRISSHCDDQTRKNEALLFERTCLQGQVYELKCQLYEHAHCDCPLIQGYIAAEAKRVVERALDGPQPG
ncbi:hypothetical protein LRP88_07363 [Fusarium phalaenopsidis]